MRLVARTRPEVVAGWSDEEVARPWFRLCPGRKNPLAVAGEEDVRLEVLLKDAEKLKTCRERLGNLSWFTRERWRWLSPVDAGEGGCIGWREGAGRFASRQSASALPCLGGVPHIVLIHAVRLDASFR